jgi:hypothetical protein
MKKYIFLAIGLLVILGSIVYATIIIPKYITVQGRLTDSFDKPLSGSYNLTFRIYDTETAGNLEWQETHLNFNIIGGLFNIELGKVNPLDLNFDKPYWLEACVQGSGQASCQTLTPRVRMTSSGFSFSASKAENLTCATCRLDGEFIIPTNGGCIIINDSEVKIGPTNCGGYKLRVNGMLDMMNSAIFNAKYWVTGRGWATGITWPDETILLWSIYANESPAGTVYSDLIISGWNGLERDKGFIKLLRPFQAPRFTDIDNPNYYVDPNSTESIKVAGSINATEFYDINSGGPYQPNLRVDPSSFPTSIKINGTIVSHLGGIATYSTPWCRRHVFKFGVNPVDVTMCTEPDHGPCQVIMYDALNNKISSGTFMQNQSYWFSNVYMRSGDATIITSSGNSGDSSPDLVQSVGDCRLTFEISAGWQMTLYGSNNNQCYVSVCTTTPVSY